MESSLRFGKLAGINIGVHWSWIFIFLLLTFSLATGYYPDAVEDLSTATYWMLGAVAAVLLFVSVLLHELAHSLTARAQGLPVKEITLFLFGGVSNIQEEPPRPRVEFITTAVGPATSLILGFLALGLGAMLEGVSPAVTTTITYVGIINILLGGFNLIPGFPLDGGRILRSVVWAITDDAEKATRWASIVGVLAAWLLIGAGVATIFFTGAVISGVWFAFIGWFLLQAAKFRYQQAAEPEEGEPA